MINWKAFVNFIQLQRSVRTIDLEKIYENTIESPGESVAEMSVKTIKYFGDLMKDSVYVDFLKKLKDKADVTDTEIKETIYYQETWGWMNVSEVYQGKSEEAALKYCRKFLAIYWALKKRADASGCFKIVRTVLDHFKFGYPCLFKIEDSDYWMVGDGHHRVASLYVLGQKFVRAKIEVKKIRRDVDFDHGRVIHKGRH